MGHPNWCRSYFPKMWLKHKSIYNRCYGLNFKFLIGYLESPENSDPDDIFKFLFLANFIFLSQLLSHRCFQFYPYMVWYRHTETRSRITIGFWSWCNFNHSFQSRSQSFLFGTSWLYFAHFGLGWNTIPSLRKPWHSHMFYACTIPI